VLKVIVGRNKGDNERIGMLAKTGAVLYSPSGFRGPTAIARGVVDEASEMFIGGIIARYSQDVLSEYTIRKQVIKGDGEKNFAAERFAIEHVESFLIGSKSRISVRAER
ncbi:MAG TPA: hypothetical protein VLZ07_08045, partial [Syntrophales bacterium]|nr:hypothetical protein [Syntrophales bacterium]